MILRMLEFDTARAGPLQVGGRAGGYDRVKSHACICKLCVVSCFYLQLQELFSLLFSPRVSGPALVRAPISELALAQGKLIINVESNDPLPYAKLMYNQNG